MCFFFCFSFGITINDTLVSHLQVVPICFGAKIHFMSTCRLSFDRAKWCDPVRRATYALQHISKQKKQERKRRRNVLHMLLNCWEKANISGGRYKRNKTWRISLPPNGTRNMNLWCSCAHCWFAFYLEALLHLALDATPACEHCRTSIWNVLWRNPISGFNGSSEAAHPGSREICARVKLVFLINSPIFNYWH